MDQSPEFQRLLRARRAGTKDAARRLPGEIARSLAGRPSGHRGRGRRAGWGEAWLAVLGGIGAGLVWAMLPGPAEDAAPIAKIDPWAESKRSKAILEAQEGAPASLVSDNGRLIRRGTSAATGATTASARFGLCHAGGGVDCVVDGDTFWMAGEKIRIADIDTPETHPPRCAEEARLGAAAAARLHALLNAGPVTLERIDRDTDRHGRKLRVVTRDGESLGGVLVDEGLARWYDGGRRSWC